MENSENSVHDMRNQKMERLYCVCNKAFQRRAKLAATQQGLPLGDFVCKAIAARLAAHEKKPLNKLPFTESKYAPKDETETAWMEEIARQLRRKQPSHILRFLAEEWTLPLAKK